jgi:hypothetical protein
MSEMAEGARLEIVCAAKSGTEGSNPSLSANLKTFKNVLKAPITGPDALGLGVFSAFSF